MQQRELHKALWQSRKALRETEVAHFAMKEALDTGEEGGTRKYELAYTIYRSTCEFYLGLKS